MNQQTSKQESKKFKIKYYNSESNDNIETKLVPKQTQKPVIKVNKTSNLIKQQPKNVINKANQNETNKPPVQFRKNIDLENNVNSNQKKAVNNNNLINNNNNKKNISKQIEPVYDNKPTLNKQKVEVYKNIPYQVEHIYSNDRIVDKQESNPSLIDSDDQIEYVNVNDDTQNSVNNEDLSPDNEVYALPSHFNENNNQNTNSNESFPTKKEFYANKNEQIKQIRKRITYLKSQKEQNYQEIYKHQQIYLKILNEHYNYKPPEAASKRKTKSINNLNDLPKSKQKISKIKPNFVF